MQKTTDEYICPDWIDTKAANLQTYEHVFGILALVDGMVVLGDRIAVPETLRQKKIELAQVLEGKCKYHDTTAEVTCLVPGKESFCDKFVSTRICCQSTHLMFNANP